MAIVKRIRGCLANSLRGPRFSIHASRRNFAAYARGTRVGCRLSHVYVSSFRSFESSVEYGGTIELRASQHAAAAADCVRRDEFRDFASLELLASRIEVSQDAATRYRAPPAPERSLFPELAYRSPRRVARSSASTAAGLVAAASTEDGKTPKRRSRANTTGTERPLRQRLIRMPRSCPRVR